MNIQPTYKSFNLTVAAGSTLTVSRQADFLICLSANHSFKLRFEHGHTTEFQAGLTFHAPEGQHYTRVEIINPHETDPLVVELGFGKGGISDSRLTLAGEIGTRARIPETFNNHLKQCANASVTQLLAANPNRDEVTIWASNSAPNRVYVGGNAAASVNHGLPIEPGQSYTVKTTAAIYIRNDTGAGVWVHAVETEFTT